MVVTPLSRGAEDCNQSVCVSICEHISGTAGPIFTNFFVHICHGHGSVLLWRRCDTLCTSTFMDDVTFGHNGLYGVFQHRGGVWGPWMPCCKLLQSKLLLNLNTNVCQIQPFGITRAQLLAQCRHNVTVFTVAMNAMMRNAKRSQISSWVNDAL